VDLTTAASAFEADVIVQALRAQDIPAEAFTLAASMLQWEIAGTRPFRVSVRRADLDRARAALQSLKADSIDIDWEDLDTGPEQDTGESPESAATTVNLWRLLWIALGAVLIVGAILARSRYRQ
jgi:hypothetical protein